MTRIAAPEGTKMISYRHPRSLVGLLLLWVPLLALQLGGDVPAVMDVVRVAGITFFLVVVLLAARDRGEAIPRVEALWAAHRTSQPMSAEQRSVSLGG